MTIGDWAPPPGWVWSDAIGWHPGQCTCGQSGHEIGCPMSDYRPAQEPTPEELAEFTSRGEQDRGSNGSEG